MSIWFRRKQDISALIKPKLTQLSWSYYSYYSFPQQESSKCLNELKTIKWNKKVNGYKGNIYRVMLVQRTKTQFTPGCFLTHTNTFYLSFSRVMNLLSFCLGWHYIANILLSPQTCKRMCPPCQCLTTGGEHPGSLVLSGGGGCTGQVEGGVWESDADEPWLPRPPGRGNTMAQSVLPTADSCQGDEKGVLLHLYVFLILCNLKWTLYLCGHLIFTVTFHSTLVSHV